VGDGLCAAAHQIQVGNPPRTQDREGVEPLGREIHPTRIGARRGGDEEHVLLPDPLAEALIDRVEDLGHVVVSRVNRVP
jgi:hypothetical protein